MTALAMSVREIRYTLHMERGEIMVLTLARSRELLGDAGSEMSNKQVELLSGQLYALSDVATDLFIELYGANASCEAKPERN
jgi:hypothetical protein